MDKNTVLSLSPNPEVLTSRESTLRDGGLNVKSVLSAVEARFEIEMGRCGSFLLCYRVPWVEADELTKLFRRNCPEGWIIFLTEPKKRAIAPIDADVAVSESNGPDLLLNILKGRTSRRAA
jgi:hypothetical protein